MAPSSLQPSDGAPYATAGLSRSLIAREQDATLIAVIEMGRSAGGGNRAGNRPYFGPGCVTATPTSLTQRSDAGGT